MAFKLIQSPFELQPHFLKRQNNLRSWAGAKSWQNMIICRKFHSGDQHDGLEKMKKEQKKEKKRKRGNPFT